MKYILMLCIGLIWGSQFLLNDIILKSFSPLGLAALRMFFGFITLSVLIFILPKERKKKVKLDKKLLVLFIALGATDAAIPFYLIGYGQTQLDSAVVAIILGIIPVFTAILQNLVGKGKKSGKWEFVDKVEYTKYDKLKGEVGQHFGRFKPTVSQVFAYRKL